VRAPRSPLNQRMSWLWRGHTFPGQKVYKPILTRFIHHNHSWPLKDFPLDLPKYTLHTIMPDSNVSSKTGTAPPSEAATARSLWDGRAGRTRRPASSHTGGHARAPPPGTSVADPRHALTTQNMDMRSEDERDATGKEQSSRYTASASKRSSTQPSRPPSRTSVPSSHSTVRPSRRSPSRASQYPTTSRPQSPEDYKKLGFTGSKDGKGKERWQRSYIDRTKDGITFGTEVVEIHRRRKGK